MVGGARRAAHGRGALRGRPRLRGPHRRDAGARLHTRAGEQGREAWTLRLLGEIDAHPPATSVDTAESLYRQALALAERLGMRPLVAHCHLGLGTLYRRTNDRAKAAEHLTTARAMYGEMEMEFWLEKAKTELGGVER
jgi:Tetratricopeptide repeat